MNIEQARYNMVMQHICTWETLDRDVHDLLCAAPREDFALPAYRNLAFSGTGIPLGFGAVMLPPKIEARALQALQLKNREKVLVSGAVSVVPRELLAQFKPRGRHACSRSARVN